MREGLEKLLRQGKGWFSPPALAVLAIGCLLLLMPTGEKAATDTRREEKTALFDLEAFEQRLEQVEEIIRGIESGQLPLEDGYIPADETTCTAIPGVYAVGDVRTKRLRQVVTAVADGAMAVHMAEEYLAAN